MYWISVTAAAHRLGVTSHTLRRYTAKGKPPDVRGVSGLRIFSDIEALTSKRTQGLYGQRPAKTRRLRTAVAAGTCGSDAA
jgi:predicted site-specific integrase-resolvase